MMNAAITAPTDHPSHFAAFLIALAP